ncbi:MAG: hypothetical protein HYY06_17985 [Deltaproteobacteria bacterium]|nr:hypothetical protein [Deltaproteobacteria bacterium]
MDKLAERLLGGIALALVGVRWVPIAEAQEDPTSGKRVVVLKFTGTQAGRARTAVVLGLKRSVILVDEAEFSDALAVAQGPTRPDRIAAACRTMEVDAVIEGEMHRVSRAWSVEVWVRDCRNGEKVSPAGRATFTMRNLGGVHSIAGSLWSRIGAAVVASGAGPAEVGVAARAPPRSVEPAPARPAAPARSAAPTRPAAPPRPAAPRADERRVASAYLTECLFEEDEPPEGFPSHADWVRRRNAFMVSCERERVRRAAAERRAREEAERARAEAERRARDEAARARAEAERRARDEAARARAEAERRARDEAERRVDGERRAREEELARARIAEQERRRAQDEERRRASSYEEPTQGAFGGEERRRREDQEIEAQVAAYRERLRREGAASGAETGGDASTSDAGRDDAGSYYDYEPREDRRGRDPAGEWSRGRRGRDDPGAGGERWERERRPAPSGPARRGPTVFHVGAGISYMYRQMSVEVANTDDPRTYEAPGFPELTIAAELFPAALAGASGAASGLGLFGTFRRALYVATSGPSGPDSPGAEIDVPTAEQELLGGGLFRVPMGTNRRSPIFSLSVGYGTFVFQLDRDAMSQLDPNKQMATMYYQNVVGAVGVSIPLTSSGLAFDFGGSYRYVLDVGQEARDLFGSDTKGGYGFGLHGGLGGEASFMAEGLLWSFSADYLVFGTEFEGPSSCLDGALDCFPSGIDRYFRGMFQAGYRYR